MMKVKGQFPERSNCTKGRAFLQELWEETYLEGKKIYKYGNNTKH